MVTMKKQRHANASESLWIRGFHTVKSMLKEKPEQVDLLVLVGRHPGHRLLVALARTHDIPFTNNLQRVPESLRKKKHSVAFARLSAAPYEAFENILEGISSSSIFILLDHLQDPTNLGNLLRSAAAVGADAILLPKHRGVRLTPTVAQIAAGALAYIKLCRYGSLQYTIRRLQERGVWVVAADPFGTDPWYEMRTEGPMALVIGHEGKGLTNTARQLCDQAVRIPMKNVESLNAATTAAILLFEIVRQRRSCSSASR